MLLFLYLSIEFLCRYLLIQVFSLFTRRIFDDSNNLILFHFSNLTDRCSISMIHSRISIGIIRIFKLLIRLGSLLYIGILWKSRWMLSLVSILVRIAYALSITVSSSRLISLKVNVHILHNLECFVSFQRKVLITKAPSMMLFIYLQKLMLTLLFLLLLSQNLLEFRCFYSMSVI